MLMNKPLQNCPRCKGIGKVYIRTVVMCNDKSKKWCGKCNDFLTRDQFYARTTYCKVHHNTLNRPGRKRTKHFELKCKVCGKIEKGWRQTQTTCSKACRVTALKLKVRAKKVERMKKEKGISINGINNKKQERVNWVKDELRKQMMEILN